MCYFKENLKRAVLAHSIIFVLIGVALVTVGTVYNLAFSDVNKAIPLSYDGVTLIPILTIFAGSLIFSLAFFGWFGVIYNSFSILLTYGFILVATLIFQISIGIFTFVEVGDRDDLSQSVNTTLKELFMKPDHDQFITLVQSQLRCCGTYGPNFWNKTMDKPFPDSCCMDDACIDVYSDGCQDAMYTLFIETARVIGFSHFGFSFFEISGVILVFLMIYEARKTRGYLKNQLEFPDDSSED